MTAAAFFVLAESAVREAVDKARARFDINRTQWRLLVAIKGTEDASGQDIAYLVGQSKQSISARIIDLAERGLIERTAFSEDGRRTVYVLTAKGLEAEGAISDAAERVLSRAGPDIAPMLAAISPSRAKALTTNNPEYDHG